MNFQLTDYQTTMMDLKRRLDVHLRDYQEINGVLDEWQQIQKLYDTKLQAAKPEVMVYGIYNAGKSSIINELLGEDRARVSDIPTTDSVDYYDWRGYRLADTPGVGAPIAHTQITQEHLRQADVVIFVMSTTGSNERKENYLRMKDIVDAGKKIIIVLNDKNGDLFRPGSERSMAEIRSKVVENMSQIGIQDVEKKYCIIFVNAQRALKGRQLKKEELLKKSNMQELTTVIMQELKKTNRFTILANTVQEVEKIVEDILQKCEQNLGKSAGADFNMLQEKIREARKDVRANMGAFIDRQGAQLAGELPFIIWPKTGKAAPDADELVKRKFTQVNELIQKKLENEIKFMAEGILEDLEQFNMPECNFNFQPDTISVNVEGENPEGKENTNFSGKIKDVLQTLSEVYQEMPKDMAGSIKTSSLKDNVQDAALGAVAEKAAGIAVKKGAAKALGSIVMPTPFPLPLPPLSVIIPLVLKLGKIIFGKSDEEKLEEEIERQNEREQQRAAMIEQAREELNQKCHYMAAQYADTMKISVDTVLLDIYQSLMEPIKETISSMQGQESKRQEDLAALREILNGYNELESQLRVSAEVK